MRSGIDEQHDLLAGQEQFSHFGIFFCDDAGKRRADHRIIPLDAGIARCRLVLGPRHLVDPARRVQVLLREHPLVEEVLDAFQVLFRLVIGGLALGQDAFALDRFFGRSSLAIRALP